MASKKKEKTDSSFIEQAKNRSKGDRIFDAILFFCLTLIFLVVAYPLYFIIISSVSDPIAVAGGEVIFLPVGFTLEGYQAVFKEVTVMRGFINSVFYTTLGIIINLIVTVPTAYALSRKDFPLKRPIVMFYIVTMFVSGGMMPTYLIVKATGLLDSVWALVIPGAISVYNMIIARTFFSTNIPIELLEASKLDGCGNTRFFINICLPISGAIIAILVLYCGVGHWNSYFSALLYIVDRTKWPLQMELRSILLQNSMATASGVLTGEALAEQRRLEAVKEMMKYSLIIVSSIPVLVMYPFIQKHFVKGVTIGSVKG